MPELPTGTVTFLFSDIEGSTRMVQALGDAWPALLERHRELLNEAFRAQNGISVGSEGDSLFVVFPSAPGAVEGAIAGHRALAAEPWPDGHEIRVRIGMHSGEASLSTDGYTGLDVHRAARIAAVGHGGQTLISDATRALVAQSLAAEIELRDLGQLRLKDLVSPERIWQVLAPGLEREFPPLGTPDATANNLPSRLTTFLGREREITEIGRALADARLLTLTGPGGTGKTRLALEVAERTMSRYPDGVWFVELGPITEPDLVPATIAQTLGLPDRGGRSAIDRLSEYLRDRRTLLVLDNFEQIVSAAPAINELLTGAGKLSVLVTSRSVLHLYGEREYPVPPLDLPDPRHLPADLSMLTQFEAVRLFIERAQAVKPDFEVTNDNAPAVAEICVRLDGLPLAIELAAARIRILTPQAMLSRIGNRLGLLSTGSRDLPARQQTLRGAIAWSHDLLDETERALFACLSVFIGSAGLESVERVCGSEVAADPLDALTSLVDKSLVRQFEDVAGEPRFAMLETIREFAREQAAERGSWDDLRRRHGELFLERAEQAEGRVMSSDKRRWLDALEEEHDNLRAALTWAIEASRAETACRMVAALWRFWQMRGYLAEGLERAEAVLAMPDVVNHPEARARALDAAAGLAYWQGSLRARDFYEQELEQWRALGNERGVADTLYAMTFTYTYQEAGRLTQDSFDKAQGLIEEALEIYRRLDDQAGIARSLWALGNGAYAARDQVRARQMSHEAREIFRTLDDKFMEGWSTYTGAFALLFNAAESPTRDEDLDQAEREFGDALRIFHEAGDVSGYTLVLDGFAATAYMRGDRDRAARLSGAVAALERTSGTGLNLQNRTLIAFDPSELRDDAATEEAFAAGERLGVAEAVDLALVGNRTPAAGSS